jgi:antitoxin MazE
MQSALRKIGNSTGIVLPRPILGAMGIAGGTMLELTVEDGRLIGTPVKSIVRQGWDTAAAAIGASELSRADSVWIDPVNDSDADWTW